MDKSLAEFIGTFALVFIGCGAAVIGGGAGLLFRTGALAARSYRAAAATRS